MQTQYYCYRCFINTTDFSIVNVHVTDFPVIKVHVDELSSARIWQHKLCAALSISVNINCRLPIKVIYGCHELFLNSNMGWRILVKPECVLSFNMGWRILVGNGLVGFYSLQKLFKLCFFVSNR
jgi:hypothetical protein